MHLVNHRIANENTSNMVHSTFSKEDYYTLGKKELTDSHKVSNNHTL